MGIYIKGMRMPNGDEEVMVSVKGDGVVRVLNTNILYQAKGVRVPHGGLIDRDDTFEAVDNLAGYSLGIDDALDYILAAEELIEAEE